MNSKTVFGLSNILIDGDTESPDPSEEEPTVSYCITGQSIPDNEIEVMYEANNFSDLEETTSWKKYIPIDLKKPTTTNLLNNSTVEENSEAATSTSTLKTKNENLCNDTDSPKSKKTSLPASRRRPTTIIKSLSRSELAEKYDTLLDRRLELVNQQQKKN